MNKDTFFGQKHTLNLKGTLHHIQNSQIMGIINVNNDSFYEKSRYHQIDEILNQVAQFEKEGATFIDVGASSSRPGAILKSADEEINILLPVVQQISKAFPNLFISIDTVYANVAERCINVGAHMINDISAGSIDKQMFQILGQLKVPYVLMHMPGNPQNMQLNTDYEGGVIEALFQFFERKLNELYQLGVHDVIIDLGFCFGKTIAQNFELFKNQHIFDYFGCVQLLGISRKSMLYKALNIEVDEALNGSTILHTLAIAQSAKIIRVHDVKEAMEAVKVVEWIKNGYNG